MKLGTNFKSCQEYANEQWDFRCNILALHTMYIYPVCYIARGLLYNLNLIIDLISIHCRSFPRSYDKGI